MLLKGKVVIGSTLWGSNLQPLDHQPRPLAIKLWFVIDIVIKNCLIVILELFGVVVKNLRWQTEGFRVES